MSERLTDGARRALVVAQDESRLFSNSVIGTEHLLLGVLHEREDLGARALEELDLPLDTLADRLARYIRQAGSQAVRVAPFTDDADAALRAAFDEALKLGHEMVGTEHLLLGLLRNEKDFAAQILSDLGVDYPRVHRTVFQLSPENAGLVEANSVEPGPVGQELPQGHRVACSFCGRTAPESGQLVAGNDAVICEHCIAHWFTNLRSTQPATVRTGNSAPKPKSAGTGAEARGDARAARAGGELPGSQTEATLTLRQSGSDSTARRTDPGTPARTTEPDAAARPTEPSATRKEPEPRAATKPAAPEVPLFIWEGAPPNGNGQHATRGIGSPGGVDEQKGKSPARAPGRASA